MIPDTIEIKISEPLTHSKLGITSVLIAVVVWIYFFLAGYIFFYGGVAETLFPKEINPDVGILAFVTIIFTHLAVCSVGFVIGLVFGFVSLTLKNKKRMFAVIGVILNCLPIILAICCAVYFFSK